MGFGLPGRPNYLGADESPSPNPLPLVPNILHLVRYNLQPLNFTVGLHPTLPSCPQEAICLKAFLLHQRPAKLYLHSNLVDLTQFGPYWAQLYAGSPFNSKGPHIACDSKFNPEQTGTWSWRNTSG